MRRTKEDAEQTRNAILASAMDIFYEKGYSKTTFEEIAKRINLTKGAVYWYFRNKPDIVAALINDFAGKYMGMLQKFIQHNNDDGFAKLTDLSLFFNQQMQKNPEIYKFLFFITCQMEWSEAIINKIQPSVEQTKQVFRRLFSDALVELQKQGKIKPGINVDIVCELLIALHSGILEAHFTKRLHYDFNQLMETGFNLIFNSIKTESESNEN